MNNLELNAEVIGYFYGTINGNNIDCKPVYDAMTVIIKLLETNLNEPNITNPEQFIDDLIEAFESCYYSKEYIAENIYDQYKLDDTPDYFIWIRNKFIKKLYTDKTTFKDLSDILYHLIEIDRHKEFETLYERITSGFYTS